MSEIISIELYLVVKAPGLNVAFVKLSRISDKHIGQKNDTITCTVFNTMRPTEFVIALFSP